MYEIMEYLKQKLEKIRAIQKIPGEILLLV